MGKYYYGKNKIQNLFFGIVGGQFVGFLILSLAQYNTVSKWLVMEHNFHYQFSDFFRQIVYASDLENIYFNTGDAPFPPFAYIWFHLLYRINPVEAPIKLASWEMVKNFQNNLLIFVVIMMIIAIFLFEIVIKMQCFDERGSVLFTFLILLSAPFAAGAIERGNIAIAVCVMILWAMYLKDSKEAWKKEAALLLIACSAGLKIYPAIFGLIYVREKRWKEVWRLLCYGIFVFFGPFIFTGGMAGLKQYISVISNFEASQACRWTNIRSFYFALLDELDIGANISIGVFLENICLLVFLIMVFKTKDQWRQILFLAGIMTVYIPNSYRYVSVYMLIPLMFWLKEQKGKRNDYIYCVLFSLIFCIPIYGYFIGGEADFYVFAPIYLLLGYSMCETWYITKK